VYSKPSAPRSIGGVLDDGIRLGRAAFAKTWPLAFAAQIFYALPMVFFGSQLGADAGSMQASMMAMQSSGFRAGFGVVYLAVLLVAIGFHNAIVAQNLGAAEGIERTMGESLSIGFRLVPRGVLMGILVALGFVLIAICFIIPGIFVGQLGRAALIALFLVPLFFYLGRLFLGNVIYVAEDSGAYASLLRSWHLTKDNYWRTAAILTVLFVMVFVTLFVVGLLTGFAAAALVAAKSTMSLLVVQLISAAANTLYIPFISAVVLSVYYDLKLRKEGTDLASRVDSLATR
jgi:hypothetical protein